MSIKTVTIIAFSLMLSFAACGSDDSSSDGSSSGPLGSCGISESCNELYGTMGTFDYKSDCTDPSDTEQTPGTWEDGKTCSENSVTASVHSTATGYCKFTGLTDAPNLEMRSYSYFFEDFIKALCPSLGEMVGGTSVWVSL